MQAEFSIEPPKGLLTKILNRIHKKERVLVLRKTIAISALFLLSLVAFVPSLKTLLTDFSNTGFTSFFSLIFSDFPSVATYWRSFAMILLETLPAVSLAFFLAVLLTLLESLKYLVKNIKIMYRKDQLATA